MPRELLPRQLQCGARAMRINGTCLSLQVEIGLANTSFLALKLDRGTSHVTA